MTDTKNSEIGDVMRPDEEFVKEFEKYHGKLNGMQIGEHWHYCYDWDGLPIDEHCTEYDCCYCVGFEEKLPSEIRQKALDEMERRNNDTLWEKLNAFFRSLFYRGN